MHRLTHSYSVTSRLSSPFFDVLPNDWHPTESEVVFVCPCNVGGTWSMLLRLCGIQRPHVGLLRTPRCRRRRPAYQCFTPGRCCSTDKDLLLRFARSDKKWRAGARKLLNQPADARNSASARVAAARSFFALLSAARFPARLSFLWLAPLSSARQRSSLAQSILTLVPGERLSSSRHSRASDVVHGPMC